MLLRTAIQKIIGQPHSSATSINPDLPEALGTLIDHLLEKAPENRPENAEAVARLLSPWAETTVRSEDVPPLTGTMDVAPSRPNWTRWAVIGVIVLLGLGLVWWAQQRGPGSSGGEPESLTLAVLAPAAVEEADELFAFGLRSALIRALGERGGLRIKSPYDVDAVTGRPEEVAAAVGADEAIVSTYACKALTCWATLTRVVGNEVVTTERPELPKNDMGQAARAVAVAVGGLFPDRSLRDDARRLEIEPDDYDRFLRLQGSYNGFGDTLAPATLLAELEDIRRRNPRFVDAYVLAAEVQIRQFRGSRDDDDAQEALRLLEGAERLAPDDPEVQIARIYAGIDLGRLDAAETAMEDLVAVAPGDPRVLDLRAELADARGETEAALDAASEALALSPSWRRRLTHASLALRQGETALARDSLETLLTQVPDSWLGRWLLASMELKAGDANRAAELFEGLATEAGSGDPGAVVNLGLARMLTGDLDAARAKFEAAASLNPVNAFYQLNLADVYALQGRADDAEQRYRRVLELLVLDEEDGWQTHSVRAQALAHLGDRRAAIAAIGQALERAPRDGQAAYEAALVYAVVGNRDSALVHAERALELGFESPAFFRLPWLASITDDPAFATRLATRERELAGY
ncbi:MAG: tetratricopeptide repeat protein [Acidobacteriota bacterium]